MDRATIIRLAQKAGIQVSEENSFADDMYISVLYRFAQLVIEEGCPDATRFRWLCAELQKSYDGVLSETGNMSITAYMDFGRGEHRRMQSTIAWSDKRGEPLDLASAIDAVLQEQDEVNRPAGEEDRAIYQAIADNYTAPTQPSVPEGWQLVPVDLDPYDDMTSAACDAGDLYRVDFARAWRAALAGAPKPGDKE